MTIRRAVAPMVSAALTAVLVVASVSVGRALSVPGPRPADVVAAVAAALATLLGTWLTVILTVDLLALTPGVLGRAAQALSDRLTPAIVRQVLVIVLGAGTAAIALPGPSMADGTAATAPITGGRTDLPDPGWRPQDPRSDAPSPADHGHDLGWIPTAPAPRPGDLSVLGERPQVRKSSSEETPVIVRRGDTLWDIAARHLGEGATDAQIARVWPRWWAANREVIGPDPDLILPGTRLVPPDHDRDVASPGGRRP